MPASSGTGASGIRPSNRLSHGLTSRAAAEERSGEAWELAEDLIGNVPASEEMRDVALQLANAILLLHAIRSERQALLSRLPPEFDIDPLEEILVQKGFFEGAPKSAWYPSLMRAIIHEEAIPEGKSELVETAALLRTRRSELNRLEGYERKASSRRCKLLMRLDHLRIEAMRCHS